MTKQKPRIIVLSKNTDERFDWLSDGWNPIEKPNPKLFTKADKLIKKAKDVPDAIRLLQENGFEIVRTSRRNRDDDRRVCTVCGKHYSIHQEHLAGNAPDGRFHEGHIRCVRPIIQPDAPTAVLDYDAASIARNEARGYKD
jgi:hypothetical protein